MDDYIDDYDKRMDFYDDLYSTKDQSIINTVITGMDESAKRHLAGNPYLSYVQMETLAHDADIEVRSRMARSRCLPPDLLKNLSKDKKEIVRATALCNPLTSFSDFKENVITSKFSAEAKTLICEDVRVLEDFELFEYLWQKIKGSQPILINTLEAYRRSFPADIHPEISSFIHHEIMGGQASNSTREAYAEAVYVALPEILDTLKTDPYRPVINAIARNGSAWVTTHEYLVDNHKSSGIRITISAVTNDNQLLNKIYHGTKSQEIRFWVEQNPAFKSI